MKKILFFCFFTNLCIAKVAPSLIGSWAGYCEPISKEVGSRICKLSFQSKSKLTLSCDYFKDLRCKEKNLQKSKTISENTFKVLSKKRLKIIYPNDSETEYELNHYNIRDSLLMLRGIEVKSKKDKEPFQDALGPYFYTRDNN